MPIDPLLSVSRKERFRVYQSFLTQPRRRLQSYGNVNVSDDIPVAETVENIRSR